MERNEKFQEAADQGEGEETEVCLSQELRVAKGLRKEAEVEKQMKAAR